MKNRNLSALLCLLAAQLRLSAAVCNIVSNYTIIDSPSDADDISSCGRIDGAVSFLFSNNPSSWSNGAAVSLGSTDEITGDLGIYPDYRVQKTEIKAPSLKTVGGSLTIQNLAATNQIDALNIAFSSLERVTKNYVITGGFQNVNIEYQNDVDVGGLFRLYDLRTKSLLFSGPGNVAGQVSVDSNPLLQQLSLAAISSAGQGFTIQENQVLEDLTLPKLKSVGGDLIFYNNPTLTLLEVPALESAETLSWYSNGPAANAVVSFPRLSSLGKSNTTSTSTFKNVNKIYFSSLRTVSGSLAFQSTAAEALVVPLVKSVSGRVTVEDNPSLTTFALPRVTNVNELTIKGNGALTNITANALQTAGTISLSGGFKNVEFFGLKEVKGDFSVVGDSSMDCSWFDDNVRKLVKGKYSCVGSRAQPSSARRPSTGGIEATEGNPDDYIVSIDGSGDKPSTNPTEVPPSSSSSLSTGAKVGIGIGCAIGALSLVAVVAWVLLSRRRKTGMVEEPLAPTPEKDNEDSTSASASEGGVYGGWGIGSHTTIETTNLRSSTPKLGVNLDFNWGPFIEKQPDAPNVWRTIRRVSGSAASTTPTSHAPMTPESQQP